MASAAISCGAVGTLLFLFCSFWMKARKENRQLRNVELQRSGKNKRKRKRNRERGIDPYKWRQIKARKKEFW